MAVVRAAAATLLMLLAAIAGTGNGADSQSTTFPPNVVDQGYTVLTIAPSVTDARITASNLPHVVIYDRSAKPGSILLFLAGTGGRPPGPLRFLNRAVERGYRVINLSYIDEPAVSEVCTGATLLREPECAREFRQKRIYGDNVTGLIRDAPQDSIMNRFAKLLQHLVAADPSGQWTQYLDNDSPIWNRIAVAGQSQGGGMAEFIAQRQEVGRIIAFSGGWDFSGPRELASWYLGKNATPRDRYYGTYNVAEPAVNLLSRTYAALGVPAAQTLALKLPVRPGEEAHTEGIANPAYRDAWDLVLGNGSL
jgi:hypothetical protein